MNLFPWRVPAKPGSMREVARSERRRALTYRGIPFEISKTSGAWFCHNGYKLGSTPDLLSICREDGWGSATADGCIRKVCRAIDADLRDEADQVAFAAAKDQA